MCVQIEAEVEMEMISIKRNMNRERERERFNTKIKKYANPGLFFVFFEHKFYRKTVDVSGIRTRIVGKEGKHGDHLGNTTAHTKIFITR